jgi:hypothetical protein
MLEKPLDAGGMLGRASIPQRAPNLRRNLLRSLFHEGHRFAGG